MESTREITQKKEEKHMEKKYYNQHGKGSYDTDSKDGDMAQNRTR